MTKPEFQPLALACPGVVGVVATSRRSLARHTHDQYGIGVIEHGAQRSLSGRGMVEAGPGQVITVNPGEVHDGSPIGDAPRHWRMLYFDVGLIRQAWTQVDGSTSHAFEFHHPVLGDAPSASLLRELFQMYATGSESGQALAEERLLLLLSRLGNRAKPPREEHGLAGQILAARRRIDSDPAASLTLADLAAICGLSRFQTLRGFARATGLTPHTYMVQRRIQLARELIRRGTPLARAAVESGFADQSHLSRAFVRSYGYSPGAYARAVR